MKGGMASHGPSAAGAHRAAAPAGVHRTLQSDMSNAASSESALRPASSSSDEGSKGIFSIGSDPGSAARAFAAAVADISSASSSATQPMDDQEEALSHILNEKAGTGDKAGIAREKGESVEAVQGHWPEQPLHAHTHTEHCSAWQHHK